MNTALPSFYPAAGRVKQPLTNWLENKHCSLATGGCQGVSTRSLTLCDWGLVGFYRFHKSSWNMYICNCLFLTELTTKTDVQTLTGKTLSVTAGTASPGPAPSTDTIACPYVNLLLCNAQPAGERSSHRNWIYVHNTLFSLLKFNPNKSSSDRRFIWEKYWEDFLFFVLFCFLSSLYLHLYSRLLQTKFPPLGLQTLIHIFIHLFCTCACTAT